MVGFRGTSPEQGAYVRNCMTTLSSNFTAAATVVGGIAGGVIAVVLVGMFTGPGASVLGFPAWKIGSAVGAAVGALLAATGLFLFDNPSNQVNENNARLIAVRQESRSFVKATAEELYQQANALVLDKCTDLFSVQGDRDPFLEIADSAGNLKRMVREQLKRWQEEAARCERDLHLLLAAQDDSFRQSALVSWNQSVDQILKDGIARDDAARTFAFTYLAPIADHVLLNREKKFRLQFGKRRLSCGE